MFEDVADAALVSAIGDSAHAENRACARRLAAIAELYRCPGLPKYILRRPGYAANSVTAPPRWTATDEPALVHPCRHDPATRSADTARTACLPPAHHTQPAGTPTGRTGYCPTGPPGLTRYSDSSAATFVSADSNPDAGKCLCSSHHLLKTFWTGWRDEQLPDGRVVWTSPTGHKYLTRPGRCLLFPALCLPTGQLPIVPTACRPPRGDRGATMPTRRRTRQQDRAHHIDAERTLNAARVAERKQAPPF